MSGVAAGVISVFALLVGAAIVTTLVTHPSGSVGLVQATLGGFAQDLSAAEGMGGGFGSVGGSFIPVSVA